MIKKPWAFHPALGQCPLFAELGYKPAPGPHAQDWLHVLTKLFVCFPYHPKLRAGSCGWLSSRAVFWQALAYPIFLLLDLL